MKSMTIDNLETLDYDCTEAVNTLCTNLTFSNAHKIMFTSCKPNEGKSFLAMHVMRTLASVGKKVVLVDADLRKSVLVARYGLRLGSDPQGLCHYLAQQCDIDDIIYETNLPGAYMVPEGRDVINSMQLLSGTQLPLLFQELERTFDYVLVDAPPVGMIIDAAIIARVCDGTVFVISDGQVSKRELLEAKQQIEKSGCPVLGAVFNMVHHSVGSYQKYYYRHGYTRYGGYYRRGGQAGGYYRRSEEATADVKKSR